MSFHPPVATPIARPPTSPSPEFSTDHTRENYIQLLQSPESQRALGLGVPVFSIVIATLACFSIVGFPFGIVHFAIIAIRHASRRTKFNARIQRIRRCVPIHTYVLMANTQLYQQADFEAPGLVMGSFERDLGHDFYLNLVTIIEAARQSPESSGPDGFVKAAFADMKYVPNRRRLLPSELTADIPVYIFDVVIRGAHLPRGKLDNLLVPCLADPGPNGEIFTIPWNTMDGWRDLDFISRDMTQK